MNSPFDISNQNYITFTFSLHYAICIIKQWLNQPISFCSVINSLSFSWRAETNISDCNCPSGTAKIICKDY